MVAEHFFVRGRGGRTVAGHEPRPRRVPRQTIEHGSKPGLVSDLHTKPDTAIDVGDDERGLTRLEESEEERVALHGLCRDHVLVEERGKTPGGIQHEGVLVRPIHRAFVERVEHVGALAGGEEAGVEHRHLTLEHLLQMLDGRRATVGGEANQVVRVIEAVGSPTAADRGIEMVEGCVAQRGHVVDLDVGLAREARFVHAGPILRERRPEFVHHGFSRPVVIDVGR